MQILENHLRIGSERETKEGQTKNDLENSNEVPLKASSLSDFIAKKLSKILLLVEETHFLMKILKDDDINFKSN